MDAVEKSKLRAALTLAFTPSAPVGSLDLFSGRMSQLERVTEAVLQPGQHVAIYGERGVGKTSLANVLPSYLQPLKHNYEIVRHNCSVKSTFNSIWDGILRELTFKRTSLESINMSTPIMMGSYLPEDARPEDVRFLLQQTGSSIVAIIDEYDRVPKDNSISSLIADTIKSLSDHAVDATLIIIGVADTIDELIEEHRSIERALVQVLMPRMSENELLSIVEIGFKKSMMEIDSDARSEIALLSQGLPHNAHELGLRTGYASVAEGRLKANKNDVELGIRSAVKSAQQTLVATYCQAIASPHESMYKEILLAAALAKTDDIGYFSAGDLRQPLALITRKEYGIDAYMRHLNSFCSDSRGCILERRGERRRYRFRFSEPIMEPYVILRGIAEELIKKEDVINLESNNYKTSTRSLF